MNTKNLVLVLLVGGLVRALPVEDEAPAFPGLGALTPAQARGLTLWRTWACQSCHQIHGWGGFIGPDVTNVMSRRRADELDALLVEGRRQMPGFGFDERQRSDLVAFLQAIDRTGTSPPVGHRLPDDLDFDFTTGSLDRLPGGAPDETVIAGEEQLRRSSCNQCHRPFRPGLMGAPDLTMAAFRQGPDAIRRSVREGRGPMPAFPFLDDDALANIAAYLHWLHENRRELGSARARQGG